MENPVDAAWGPDGLLYIQCQHEGRVIRVGADGLLERVAGTGMVADGLDVDNALEAEMGFGAGLAIASDGTLYISDNTFSRVRRVIPGGGMQTILGTATSGQGEPGYGPEMAIQSPERLVLDEARRRLLVADTLNNRVLALDLESLEVELVAGTGERGYSGDGGPAVEATLRGPVGLAVTEDGTVIIADLENDVLRAVSPQGGIDTIAGGVEGDPELHGAPLDFPMLRPAGLAWTAEGDLLIAERSGHRVLRWMEAKDAI
jgi:DNA-binding beta-propeller fold protein YncE